MPTELNVDDWLSGRTRWDGGGGSASPNLVNLVRGGSANTSLNTVALNRDLDVLANLPTSANDLVTNQINNIKNSLTITE